MGAAMQRMHAPSPATPSRAVATIDHLRHRAWILNPDGCGFRHALAPSLAQIAHRLHVQFELDAAPQEHLAMVAAGLGCSIVPASARAALHVASPRRQTAQTGRR